MFGLVEKVWNFLLLSLYVIMLFSLVFQVISCYKLIVLGYLWITAGTVGENLYCNSQLELWIIILLIENCKGLEFCIRVMIFTDKFFGILVFFVYVVLLFK